MRKLVAILLLLALALAAQAQGPASTKPNKHLPQVSLQEQFLPYWTLENGWHTELELRSSHGTMDITVTPALRFAAGNEIQLSPVTLKPNQIVAIDLHEALTKSNPEVIGKPDSYGSVVVRFESHHMANIYAAAMVGMIGAPVAYHFDGLGRDMKFAAGDYEGLWWLPKTTTKAFVILTNSSDKPVHPELTWFSASGKGKEKLFPLGPRQTRRIDIREATDRLKIGGEYGGVRLSVSDDAGSMQLAHIVYDVVASFSALIRLHPRNPEGKVGMWTIRAPMVALSVPDTSLAFPDGTVLQSRVFLRNATAAALPVGVNVAWKRGDDTGLVSVPLAELKPEEARLLDLSALQASGQLPKDANWAGVHLTYEGRLGDLVATARSFSEDLRYGAQSPFRVALSGKWRGGMWRVDDTRNSLISAGNGGKEPITIAIAFTSKDGAFRYDLPDRVVQPGEQTWVDVAKLIRTQIPDKNGKTLPMSMTAGSYQIEDAKGPPVGYVFEGKLIIDKKYGHVGYGCMNCCGFTNAFQTLDPLEIIANGTNQQRAKAINNCNYGEEDFTNYSYGWYSTNTSVAAVFSGGMVEGVAVGEAEVYGFFDANSFFVVAESCPADQQTSWSTVRVPPVIHQITGNGNIPMLNSGYQGRDSQTLSSSVSPTGGTYSWTAISGASKVNLLNATSSSVIVQSVAVGAATIQLQYTYNGISATKTYAVQVRQPTSLSTLANDTSTFDCGAIPYNTTKREIRYQVLDGAGQGLNADSMKANELLTTTSNNCNVSNPTEGPTADTSASGVFGPDELLMCTAACLPADSNRNPLGSCTVNVTQVWKVNGYTVRTNALSYQCSGPTVTPQ